MPVLFSLHTQTHTNTDTHTHKHTHKHKQKVKATAQAARATPIRRRAAPPEAPARATPGTRAPRAPRVPRASLRARQEMRHALTVLLANTRRPLETMARCTACPVQLARTWRPPETMLCRTACCVLVANTQHWSGPAAHRYAKSVLWVPPASRAAAPRLSVPATAPRAMQGRQGHHAPHARRVRLRPRVDLGCVCRAGLILTATRAAPSALATPGTGPLLSGHVTCVGLERPKRFEATTLAECARPASTKLPQVSISPAITAMPASTRLRQVSTRRATSAKQASTRQQPVSTPPATTARLASSLLLWAPLQSLTAQVAMPGSIRQRPGPRRAKTVQLASSRRMRV
jgi:hypothetical protein